MNSKQASYLKFKELKEVSVGGSFFSRYLPIILISSFSIYIEQKIMMYIHPFHNQLVMAVVPFYHV